MKKIGAILEGAGVIDEIQLVRALSHHRKWRCRLGKSLIELGFVDEETIAKTVANQLGYRYIELAPGATPRELFETLPKKLAEEKLFFPVGYSNSPGDKSVVIAFSDPTDSALIDAVGKQIGTSVEPVVARDSSIDDAVRGWDRWQVSNPPSSHEATLLKAHEDSTPAFDKIEDAGDAEHKKPGEVKFKPPTTPEVRKPPPEVALQNAPPDILLGSDSPDAKASDSAPDILSVSDLHPIDEDKADSAPAFEVDHSDPWEHAMPERTGESKEAKSFVDDEKVPVAPAHEQLDAPEQDIPAVNDIEPVAPPPEILHGRDALSAESPDSAPDILSVSDLHPIDGKEADSAPAFEVDHSDPWEHAMPERTGESKEAKSFVDDEKVPVAPAHEQLDAPEQDIPAVNDIEPVAPPPDVIPTPEETFASSPARPDADGTEPDMEGLNTSAPPSPPSAGEEPDLHDDEPELLSPGAIQELPDESLPKPTPPNSQAEVPKPEKPSWPDEAPSQEPAPTLPAPPPARSEQASSEQKTDTESTTEDIRKEMKELREEVAQLKTLVETLLKKSGDT